MVIRRVPEITAAQENARLVPLGPGMVTLRRDPVEPVPVGSVVVMMFRVAGYDSDCDGSLMSRLERIEAGGESTGWSVNAISLYPDSTWTVDSADELDQHVACGGRPSTTGSENQQDLHPS